MNLYAKGYRGYNIQEKLYYYRIVRDEKNKHRPMKYRVDEMIVRFRGYKNMRMLLRGMPYVFKPVIIGLIPQSILKQIKTIEILSRCSFLLLWLFLRKEPYGTKSYICNHACL